MTVGQLLAQDDVIVLNERYLGRILSDYARYYNRARTHLALEKDAPDERAVHGRNSERSSRSQRSADSIIDTSAELLDLTAGSGFRKGQQGEGQRFRSGPRERTRRRVALPPLPSQETA